MPQIIEPIGYIDLNRRFVELNDEITPEDIAIRSYTAKILGREHGLGWKEILEHNLVVILGEPGSGKTWELRRCAQKLKFDGKLSFFIRLDQLIIQPLSIVLSPEDWSQFKKWISSNHEAIFFLDSIDESKLNRNSDFYVALEKLRNGIGVENLSRVKIFLSSRISEWQPITDANELLSCFHQVSFRTQQTKTSRIAEPDSEFKQEKILVVCIEPLDKERVEIFARSKNVEEKDNFIKAINDSYAWEFTRRPLDVIELIEYWNTNKRLGSFTELIETSIENKIRPALRDSGDSLSLNMAREGVEVLAAATILCRNFSFKVFDNDLITSALDAFECLPNDWNKEQCKALLSRAIFDGANYGHIRFHHRRISEYLTASWLTRLMNRGCPKYVLEKLLFDTVDGQRVMRQSLIPMIAWLCNGGETWNNDIRNWTLEVAPEIHLLYGDPVALSIEYKRNVLKKMIKKFESRESLWIESSPESLSRLADQELTDDILAIIKNRTLSDDLRREMLLIVWHGHLTSCVSAALDIISSDDESDRIKQYAAIVIRDVGSMQDLNDLWRITQHLQNISNDLLATICEALFPRKIGNEELIRLLLRVNPIPRKSIDLQYYLSTHFKTVLKPELSEELLRGFIKLLQTPPYITVQELDVKISSKFFWVVDVIPAIFEKMLMKPQLLDQEIRTGIEALLLIKQIQHYDRFRSDETNNLVAAINKHPKLRQSYFWYLVNDWRRRERGEPLSLNLLLDYSDILKEIPGDINWLIDDIRAKKDKKDRELSLHLSLNLWYRQRGSAKDLQRIFDATRNNIAFVFLLMKLLYSYYISPIKQFWYWQIKSKFNHDWWWKQRYYDIRDIWIRLKDSLILNVRTDYLASGKPIHWLYNLSREASETIHDKWAPKDWEGLQKKRGKRITEAVKKGCLQVWQQHTPLLPHERGTSVDVSVVVGLTGLQTGVTSSSIELSKITPEEAILATRYAVNEMNGFSDWLNDLANYHSQSVKYILSECIKGEWNFSADRKDTYEVLSKLAWRDNGLSLLVLPTVRDLLLKKNPFNFSILKSAVNLLLKNAKSERGFLIELAPKKVLDYFEDSPCFILWVAVWLQVDAKPALKYLEERLKDSNDPKKLMLHICSALKGDRLDREVAINNPDYLQPPHLRTFIPMVFKYIHPDDDIHREGGIMYSPGARDDAQYFRSNLLESLGSNEHSNAGSILQELLNEPALFCRRDYILHLLEQRIKRKADLPIWEPKDIRTFIKDFEIDPKTDADLFKIVCRRLLDIKRDVEIADNSIRQDLHLTDDEARLRKWFARELMRSAKGRYIVPQEAEIDRQQRPDIRIENPTVRGVVSIEIKWADAQSWSLTDLFERLEIQLIGQYLRDVNAQYGIFLLGNIGNKDYWVHPINRNRLTFEEVVFSLQNRALEIIDSKSEVENVAVIGVDFRDPRTIKVEK